jgi:hypothetical protein
MHTDFRPTWVMPLGWDTAARMGTDSHGERLVTWRSRSKPGREALDIRQIRSRGANHSTSATSGDEETNQPRALTSVRPVALVPER